MTAVNYLLKYIEPSLSYEQKQFFSLVIQQAKNLEKQQIIDAHDMGYIDGGNHKKVTAEMYYAETYGSKGSETKQ